MSRDKVLVIEEDKGTRDAIKILLELNEIDVVSTSDCAMAFKKIAHDNFDLILCDLSPALTTIADLVQKVKGDPLHYKTPIVALLESGEEKDIRHAMNTGADDFVLKPFSGKVLLAAVKARLEIGKRYKKLHNKEVSEQLFSLLNKNFNQELLTPLNGIVNTTFLVESMPGIQDVDGLNELLNAIYASSYRMLRTTQNLLTYASLNVDQEHAPVKLSKDMILQDLLQLVVGYYENGMTPDMRRIDQTVLQVGSWEGPEEYVRTIFTELIDNAVKFAPNSSVPVVKLNAINNAFTLTVTNVIKDNTHFNIHDISPFKKFHTDLSRNGLGIGLFITKSICEKVGYKFSVNRKGNYLTFTVECEG